MGKDAFIAVQRQRELFQQAVVGDADVTAGAAGRVNLADKLPTQARQPLPLRHDCTLVRHGHRELRSIPVQQTRQGGAARVCSGAVRCSGLCV